MAPSADDWLAVCRRATAGVRDMLATTTTTAQRAVEIGARGAGGDRSLVIDTGAEDVIFAELDALHAEGARFVAISEERGEVDYGGSEARVVIDPIDGSLNAKRGLPAYSFSFAVASGTTMADVDVAFVYDFGNDEEWTAVRGAGATLDGARLDPALPERRGRDGRLEVLGIESADPRWIRGAVDALAERAYRLRALGTIASTLCQVAAARLDGMVTLRGCRSVDAAAGQLIVREAGGLVAFPRCATPLGAPLDLIPHSPLVAARTAQGLEELATVPVL